MQALFKCKINYVASMHLDQIYDGFEKLRKKGIIKLEINRSTLHKNSPILEVLINDKIKVIYDNLDGLNWIHDTEEKNLAFFNKNTSVDFYFKRSFDSRLNLYTPSNCYVFPLGLNFPVKPEGNWPIDWKIRFKEIFKRSFFHKTHGKSRFFNHSFEHYPFKNKENKILFSARLWNPDEVSSPILKEHRNKINEERIECIQACRKEFGRFFTGGLSTDNYSIKKSKELLLPRSFTKKEKYLKAVKEHNICVATTGLHNSIGWKFGEYIASSRAIISNPLVYDLPGNIEVNKNYLSFNTKDELLKNIEYLLTNDDKLVEMMENNFRYYISYASSEKLVLNSLLKIYQITNGNI